MGGLAVSRTVGPSGLTNSPHPSSREGHHSTTRWSSSAPIVIDPARPSCHFVRTLEQSQQISPGAYLLPDMGICLSRAPAAVFRRLRHGRRSYPSFPRCPKVVQAVRRVKSSRPITLINQRRRPGPRLLTAARVGDSGGSFWGRSSRARGWIARQLLTHHVIWLLDFGVTQHMKRGSYAQIALLLRFKASHQGQTPLIRS